MSLYKGDTLIAGNTTAVDNKSITVTGSNTLQASGVIDANTSNSPSYTVPIKTWTGTTAQYNALTTKDDNTIYITTDESTSALGAADIALSNLNSTGQAIIDGKANTSLSNLSTAGQAIIDGKVSKSGDTMTGDLYLKSSDLIFNSAVFISGSSRIVDVTSHPNMGIKLEAGSTNYVKSSFSIYNNENQSNAGYADATADVKASITNWSFPSITYTNLTSQWGATGFTVTAPANGYCYLSIENSGNAFALLNNTTKGLVQICSNPSTIGIFVIVPAAKGDVIMVNYNTTAALNAFKFIHAIGG